MSLFIIDTYTGKIHKQPISLSFHRLHNTPYKDTDYHQALTQWFNSLSLPRRRNNKKYVDIQSNFGIMAALKGYRSFLSLDLLVFSSSKILQQMEVYLLWECLLSFHSLQTFNGMSTRISEMGPSPHHVDLPPFAPSS